MKVVFFHKAGETFMNEDNLFCNVLARVQRDEDFMAQEFVPYLSASSMVAIAWTCKKLYMAYRRYFAKRYDFVGTFMTLHPLQSWMSQDTGRMSRWGRKLAREFVDDPFGMREDRRRAHSIMSYRTVNGIVHGVIKVKNRLGRLQRSMYVHDGLLVHGPVTIAKRANMKAVMKVVAGTIMSVHYVSVKK